MKLLIIFLAGLLITSCDIGVNNTSNQQNLESNTCEPIKQNLNISCQTIISGPCTCNQITDLYVIDNINSNQPSQVALWQIEDANIAAGQACSHALWLNNNMGETIIVIYNNNLAYGVFFPSTGPICQVDFNVY